MMRRLFDIFTLVFPVVLLVFCAHIAVAAWQIPPLSEENRRMIERQDERLAALTARHAEDVKRMDLIESRLFQLILATGGNILVSGGVAADRWYYNKRRRKDDV